MKNTIQYTKQNYILILAGLIIAVIGYFVMSGGNPEDSSDFSNDIFNHRRITVAPIIILLGYAIVLVGIMKIFETSDTSDDILEEPITSKNKKKKK